MFSMMLPKVNLVKTSTCASDEDKRRPPSEIYPSDSHVLVTKVCYVLPLFLVMCLL